ncbi:hypothetical protein ABW21_db0208990 [Orbilia brochopaga]|nr:hypothetical protein ABW21_db0208990 [Drechslerella brochopaga]
MLPNILATSLFLSIFSIGFTTALLPRDSQPTATAAPQLAAIYFSAPRGPFRKRQDSSICAPGTNFCAIVDDVYSCAPVCCIEDGEYTGGGCELGYYCVGSGTTAGCCPEGETCSGPPAPCADYTDRNVVQSPTSACPQDYPICSKDSEGGQACTTAHTIAGGRTRTGFNSGLISVPKTSTTRRITISDDFSSPMSTTTPTRTTPVSVESTPTTTAATTVIASTTTSRPTIGEPRTIADSTQVNFGTTVTGQPQATGGSNGANTNRALDLTPAFGLIIIALTFFFF